MLQRKVHVNSYLVPDAGVTSVTRRGHDGGNLAIVA
jgi:hypothetical protein